MQILVDADETLHSSQDLMARIEGVVEGALERFSERITRVEVHLSDLKSHRPGERDMCCHMEAHAVGLKPIAVSHEAVTLTEAIHAASSKLERALDQALGRAKSKAVPGGSGRFRRRSRAARESVIGATSACAVRCPGGPDEFPAEPAEPIGSKSQDQSAVYPF